ncbi:hypothetical protein M5689_006758 [Euphorbia peplus]|nr:hypothetical protein M5689_006758 [Euphorbia peplus]
MEGKQLDFNRPLLSVRRFSPAVSTSEAENKRKPENVFPRAPPVYKSELRSGPVRNPGTVPFVWEQSPGRPKYETKPQTFDRHHAPAIPRLPPGRPGRTLNADKQALEALEASEAPHSETKSGPLGSQNAPLLEKTVIKEESSGDGTGETDGLGLEDDQEAYVDAMDALSRSESFFLNCSVSGVSGLDCPDLKQWGTSSTDQQTRDFMMGRFLPAAKAMASETPQYSSKKHHPISQEQTSKLLTMEKWHPFSEGRRFSSNLPHCKGEEVREDEDDIKKQASILVVQPKGVQNERKRQLDKISFRGYGKELHGSSLYKRLQGNAPLHCRDKLSAPSIHEEKGLLGIPENSKDSGVNSAKSGMLFKEFLAAESDEWESASSSPLVEKTLYIDSVHMPKPQGINEHNRDGVTSNGEVEETGFAYSSFQDDDPPANKENTLSKSLETGDIKMVSMKFKNNQDLRDFSTSKASPKMEIVRHDVGSNLENQLLHMKLSDEEISKCHSVQKSQVPLPLPLPLPKSPSESWLKRALPSVSTKLTGSRLHPRVEASKTESPDSKWETIVKTAKVQHGHLRYSEELLSTIPEV